MQILILFLLLCAVRAEAAIIGMPSNFLTLNTGLVGHWTFDGTDMVSNILDRSGEANHARLVSMSTSTAIGRIGQGVNFEGITDARVQVSAASSINDTIRSISLWVRPTSLGLQGMVSKYDDNSGENGWMFRMANTSGQMSFLAAFSGGNLTASSPAGTFVRGEWGHYVLTWDGTLESDNVRMFKNGVELSLSRADGVGSYNTDSVRVLFIGNGRDNADQPFNGVIDDVRVYNRILRPDEILRLYHVGATAKVGQSPTDTLTSGLVGYWTFDGNDVNWITGAVTDKSQSGNTGYVTNMSTTTTPAIGRIGQALDFDSIDNRVTTGADTMGTGAVTLSAWIFPRTIGENNNGRIIGNETTRFRMAGSNRLLISSDAGVTSKFSAANALRYGEWNHALVTRDASGIATIYVNGVSSGTVNESSGTPGAGTTNVQIGSNDAFGNTFDGLIDDVRIYNRILRHDEIQKLYNMGATTKIGQSATAALTANLVAHWTFDGSDVNWITGSVADRSGLGNNGFVHGLMATSSAPVIGKVGQAIRFDGVNDSIRATGMTSLLSQSQATWTYWMKLNTSSATEEMLAGAWATDPALREWRISTGEPSCGAGNDFDFYEGDGEQVCTTSNIFSDPSAWYHVALTFNGSLANNERYKLYVNGSRQTLDSISSTIDTTINLSPGNVRIGTITTDNGMFSDASLDDFRIYNRALRHEEIVQLYNMGR